ncbi:MAG: hypothetical protein SXG53_19495 [Pseudomonadota bacterium]|nr:hypothetical protein [Pseudomonadota bacterium]
MSHTIKISGDGTQYLNEQGLQQYHALLDEYATELLAEAGRLEAAGRSTSGHPEITSTLVRDADLHLRRGYRRRTRGTLVFTCQLIASVGALVTGLLFDFELSKSPLLMVIFVIVLTVTITALVIALMKE